jgi:predicted GIY-YIG superfamily endonuclease
MPNPLTQNGYIYVIANQDLTKIGITTDLKRRMKELKPDKIYATAWIKDYESLERDLHARYSRERIPQTEYFRLSQAQLEDLIEEVKRIELAEQKKTRGNVYSRQAAEQEETDEEFLQSIPTTLTDTEFKKAARDKAHPDYLATLSFRQTLFGNHDKNSSNFDRWYEEHAHEYETEQLYNELYKKNEDLNARVLNIMARKSSKAQRNRGRRY